MNQKKVEPDPLMIAAGECFMFLQWCETMMLDFVVLKEGGDDMRCRYSAAYGKEPHPSDFTDERLKLGQWDFGQIKERFFVYWPELVQQREVRDAIERVVLWRNALGHVNVQQFRSHLLYTPKDSTWSKMKNFFKCYKCLKYWVSCECHAEDQAVPSTIAITSDYIDTIYNDIQLVDLNCLYRVAKLLNVNYMGVAWPVPGGGFIHMEHRRSCP